MWVTMHEAVKIWGLPLKTIKGLLPHIKTVTVGGKTMVAHEIPDPFLNKCVNCGKEFETYVETDIYCSDKCRSGEVERPTKNMADWIVPKTPKIPETHLTAFGQWKPGKHPKRCLNCLKVYTPNQHYQKTCGRTCGNQLRHMLGCDFGKENFCMICLQFKPSAEFEKTRRTFCLDCVENANHKAPREGEEYSENGVRK